MYRTRAGLRRVPAPQGERDVAGVHGDTAASCAQEETGTAPAVPFSILIALVIFGRSAPDS